MKGFLLTLVLGLSLSSGAYACKNADGACPNKQAAAPASSEKCADHKGHEQASISAADATLAQQAAESVLSLDAPRPEGRITADLQKSLDEGSRAIAKSVKEGQSKGTCCKEAGAECCKGAGKACCNGKHAQHTALAFDGASKTIESLCPDKKK